MTTGFFKNTFYAEGPDGKRRYVKTYPRERDIARQVRSSFKIKFVFPFFFFDGLSPPVELHARCCRIEEICVSLGSI
jgi:hypothetical protein